MFEFFARIFGYLLNYIYSFVSNYGIAIIIFSILLKVVMLPISIKQQKAMKKSAKLQVKVKEIQEKYSNDQVRQSQEMMDLYKRENASPFGGCLGSIFQFIIIISMFYLVSRPLTFMKNIDPEIIKKYETELTQEEGQNLRYKEITIIRERGSEDERVYLNMNFIGLDLSDVPYQDMGDFKVLIIPALYIMTSFISMKLTTNMTKKMNEKKKEPIVVKEENVENENNENKENGEKSLVPKDNKEEDAMEEMQKQMNLMMPLMTVSIALIAPLGLALYWLVNNIIMIFERILLNKLDKKEGEEE